MKGAVVVTTAETEEGMLFRLSLQVTRQNWRKASRSVSRLMALPDASRSSSDTSSSISTSTSTPSSTLTQADLHVSSTLIALELSSKPLRLSPKELPSSAESNSRLLPSSVRLPSRMRVPPLVPSSLPESAPLPLMLLAWCPLWPLERLKLV